MLWVCFYWSHYQRVVDSGQPLDGRAANINTSPQLQEGSSLKHPHLVLSCNTVTHVEHFLWQSCFHRHQDWVHSQQRGLWWTWPCLAIQRTHTGPHTQKKRKNTGLFFALIHRRGECFNQPVIAFTKQDSSMSHFPEARNVTSSCETRRNGGSYYFEITSTTLFILSGMLSNRGGPNNTAAFLEQPGGSTKISIFNQGCWVPDSTDKSTHITNWAFSPPRFT